MKAGEYEMDSSEVADKVYEQYEIIKEALDEIRRLTRYHPRFDEWEHTVFAHLRIALDDDHSFMARGDTLKGICTALEEGN